MILSFLQALEARPEGRKHPVEKGATERNL
jgi:hypothetical protein